MFKRKLVILLLTLLSVSVSAQQEPSFSHYWAMEPSFNPAAAGKESKINVTGAFAMTLTGFEHAPRTMYVGADMPLLFMNAYHGVGVQLMNDQIGLFNHQRLALQYAYKHKMFGGMLSVGLQLGLLSEKFKGSELDLENPDDPLDISRTYYLTGGYNIKLRNPFFTIHPSVLAQTDGTTYRVNVTTRVKYTHDKKMLYAGLAYSPTNSVTALVGGLFHGITLGYSYEVYTSTLKIGNGSHEIFVGYQTELDLHKKGRNRHQSVRIL